MQRGIFISFEGSEGCGKSTQIRLLAARLEETGIAIKLTREPGGTPIGERIRDLLQYDKIGHAMKPEAELLLFAASRAQLVREVIEPALDSGTCVIADRFLDSTTVYQGVARAIDAGSVKFINEFAVGTCLPDLTFVLDLDFTAARGRMEKRENAVADRMEEQPDEFYLAVRAGYLKLAEQNPQRIRVIDSAQRVEAIAAEIWNHLQERFHGLFA
ncbi:MAG: dTMP kinase [Chthoniobacteraceae bacterium]